MSGLSGPGSQEAAGKSDASAVGWRQLAANRMWSRLLLIDTVDEVREAADDPEAFFERVLKSAGPAAMCLLIAKARHMIGSMSTKTDQKVSMSL